MQIIVEGPDASGKSTLVDRLIALTPGWRVQRSEGPEKHPGEIDQRINRYSQMMYTIFDRHPAVSQSIYGPFNGTSLPSAGLIREFYEQNSFIIYCARDSLSSWGKHQKKAHDSPEHLEAIMRHDGEIVEAYEDWAMKHAHFIYRIGDPIGRVIRAVRGMTGFDMVLDIEDFHRKFDIAYDGKPRFLDRSLCEFRYKFLTEELSEYSTNAFGGLHEIEDGNRDPGEIMKYLDSTLDALVDLVYVALGTSHLHGFDFKEAWRRVHSANMSKERAISADASKAATGRGHAFDVIKPPGWSPPSHKDLVEDNAHRISD